MLSLPTSVRSYLARGATDMRKSIDGLAGVTKQELQKDPRSGHLFVFCNRRRNEGGRRAAILCSLIGTCSLQGIEPWA